MTRHEDDRPETETPEESDDLLDVEEYDDDFAHSGGAGLVVGLILGALIGAGVTLLVAPERGEVTRRRLARRARTLTDDARDHVGEWADDARRQLRRQRRRLRKRIER